jgi:predicted CXXCH cytochrome family protein
VPQPKFQAAKLEAEHLVTIFGGKVRLPWSYFARVPVQPLEYNAGHPVDRHPISDVMDPKDSSKVLTAINCLTCHQSHSSAQPDMLVKDGVNNHAFCKGCHTEVMKTEVQ